MTKETHKDYPAKIDCTLEPWHIACNFVPFNQAKKLKNHSISEVICNSLFAFETTLLDQYIYGILKAFLILLQIEK